MIEEIQEAMLNFQTAMTKLDTAGVLTFSATFTAPLEDQEALSKMPEEIRALYFSDGFEIFWMDNELGEYSGYWNLISHDGIGGVRDMLLADHPGETSALEKFVPVWWDAPETAVGYITEEGKTTLWRYSANDLEMQLMAESPKEYIDKIFEFWAIQNLSDYLYNPKEQKANYDQVLEFIESHSS